MTLQILNKNIFVLGTKIDLREDKETLSQLIEQGLSVVKREQGQKLASKIRAVKYLECSALTQRGLKSVSDFYIFFKCVVWGMYLKYTYPYN